MSRSFFAIAIPLLIAAGVGLHLWSQSHTVSFEAQTC